MNEALMRKLLMVTLFLLPAVSVANGPSQVPTEDQLAKEVASMPMPKLQARIQARAAAYKIFARTVQGFGLGDASADNASLNGKRYAVLKKRP